MKLSSFFELCAAEFPELEAGVNKRKQQADKYAELDAVALVKPVDELKPLYLELFLNMCTDQGLSRLESASPEARHSSALALAAFGEPEHKPS